MHEKTIFVADDGTEFADEFACRKHEAKREARAELETVLNRNDFGAYHEMDDFVKELIENEKFGSRFFDILKKVYGY